MTIVHRRVFYGKVGVADQLIKHLKDGDKTFKKHGLAPKGRILADYASGRTDRVVWEWEAKSVGELEAAMGKIMGDPKAKADFDKWFAKLSGLIHYAEAENWVIA